MEETRIERDSLGDVRVPAGALYGAQTRRAMENFPVSGKRPYRAFIWSVAMIKRAAAEVNGALGLLGAEKTSAIARAAAEVAAGKWDLEFVVDPIQAGAGTSHNMNANEVIANRATQLLGGALGQYLVHPNDDVNMAQSTNDVIPTAIRLGILWRTAELLSVVDGLDRALSEKAAEWGGVVKSGRTHLQDAVPVRLGQEFSGYARAVAGDRVRLEEASRPLHRLGIGGTATGTGLNAHPEYPRRMVQRLAEETGWPLRVTDDFFESMQSMADFAGFSAAIRTLALTLTRIANDLRLMSSGPNSGLDEIRFTPVQPGSSIMPGKVNPVMAEMLNMAMYHVIGLDTAVALASQAGQLELNVMMPIIAHDLFEMMQVTIGSVRAFTERGVRGLQANPPKVEAWLSRNAAVATALNPLIGYLAAAELVKEAAAANRSIRELALEKAAASKLNHKDLGRSVTCAEVESALGNVHRMTEGGIL
ncbi:MAG: aspartate ammonia-lyase [Anaerolineales bacterium]|nr:aspartate ammonia-lyase [Anaerolineales bacterium]